MHRFYVPPDRIFSGEAVIEGSEVRHLSRVLRLVTGDRVRVFDGQGHEYVACIREIRGQRALVTLENTPDCELRPSNESPLKLVLCQGIPKGDKMELILQKGTELGASRFIPLVTERVVVRLEAARAENRQIRWQRVTTEAARQCQRSVVPYVDKVQSLTSVLEMIPPGVVSLLFWEDEITNTLKELIQDTPEIPQQVWVFIGPEGGFAQKEVLQARQHGVIPVSLGPRILRTETTGMAVLTMLLYAWGDLGGKPKG